MPELPEVEVVKLFLEAKLLHKTITKLEVLTSKSFIGNKKGVIGQKIIKFSRIGKQLSVYLSNGKILLVHLKMTGQLVIGDFVLGHPTKDALKNLPNKSTRLVFTFSNKVKLFFNDQRKFGWVKIFTPEDLDLFQSNLGLDIFNPKFTPEYIYRQLQKTSRPVKLTLLDQHFFAGIGNIYANDVLFLTGIHPQTISKNITLNQAKYIHQHLIGIMQQSVLAGGSTARDNKYVRPDGTPGKNQFSFRVYQRSGQPCPKCGTPIRRISLGGRGTFFCPQCQKLSH
jgi:formamidopyrimidine-DNA glycosylase